LFCAGVLSFARAVGDGLGLAPPHALTARRAARRQIDLASCIED
jgi:hypothetical protein